MLQTRPHRSAVPFPRSRRPRRTERRHVALRAPRGTGPRCRRSRPTRPADRHLVRRVRHLPPAPRVRRTNTRRAPCRTRGRESPERPACTEPGRGLAVPKKPGNIRGVCGAPGRRDGRSRAGSQPVARRTADRHDQLRMRRRRPALDRHRGSRGRERHDRGDHRRRPAVRPHGSRATGYRYADRGSAGRRPGRSFRPRNDGRVPVPPQRKTRHRGLPGNPRRRASGRRRKGGRPTRAGVCDQS